MDTTQSFHRFTELPYELREMIWLDCLPIRIREMDWPYEYFPQVGSSTGWHIETCETWQTGIRNTQPPTITRVCKEARKIAFKAAGTEPWDVGFCVLEPEIHSELEWIDRTRSRPHIWANLSLMDIDIGVPLVMDPLGDLSQRIPHHLGPASFSLHLLGGLAWKEAIDNAGMPMDSGPSVRSPDEDEHDIECQEAERKREVIEEHPHWMVTMEHVVVHSPAARASGLFGTYGDAPIQVIDCSEQDKLDNLYELVREDEQQEGVRRVQQYERKTKQEWMSILRGVLWHQRFPAEYIERLRPAILFYLCLDGCNRKPATRRVLSAV